LHLYALQLLRSFTMSGVSSSDIAAVVFGIVAAAANLLILLPQSVSLLRTRSTEGVNQLTLGIGVINGWSAFLNVLIMNGDAFGMYCTAHGGNALQCVDKILVCLQMMMLFVGYSCAFLLYTSLFFDPNQKDKKTPMEKEAVWLGAVTLVMILAVLTYSAIADSIVLGLHSMQLRSYGEFLGYVSMLLSIVQWTPQIITVVINKSPGSFSVTMIGLMAPASLVTMLYLIFLSHQHFSTWASYLFAGLQQFALLGLCLYYMGRPAPTRTNV
jgi:uncharacterized protein with PQ loop repeat